MKAWWEGISFRERIIVVIAGIAILYVLLDMAIIQPMSNQLEQLHQDVEQAADDLDWMQQAIQKIPRGSVASAKVLQGSIATYVDGQISRSGLKKHLQQMTPIQKNAVRVRMSDVEFNQLIRFLLTLQSSVEIDEIRILPQSDAGVVDASMVLKHGSAES
jgi:general secretion pathway protein M